MVSCKTRTMDDAYDIILNDKVKDTATVLTAGNVNFIPPVSAIAVHIYDDSIAVVHNTNKAHVQYP